MLPFWLHFIWLALCSTTTTRGVHLILNKTRKIQTKLDIEVAIPRLCIAGVQSPTVYHSKALLHTNLNNLSANPFIIPVHCTRKFNCSVYIYSHSPENLFIILVSGKIYRVCCYLILFGVLALARSRRPQTHRKRMEKNENATFRSAVKTISGE